MAATPTTILGPYSSQSGTTVAAAFPQVGTTQNLDLLQIVDQGGNVLLNVDYAGAVHNPASGNTNGTRVGQFMTTLTSGTTAALFASAFTNTSNQDILQVVNQGGNVHYYLDYLGVAHGS